MKELKDKYLVIKREDLDRILSAEEFNFIREIDEKISDFREEEGKKFNEYVVLNLEDEIDLSPWSPIIKRIDEIGESHLIEFSKRDAKTRRCGHDKKPDHVKDVACSIIHAIQNGNPWKIDK